MGRSPVFARVVAWVFCGLALWSAAPARAWVDTPPGTPDWPWLWSEASMAQFLGQWRPDCAEPVWLRTTEILFEPQGRIRYHGQADGLPTRYRIIESTPYKVTLAVHRPASGPVGAINRFWVLRYLKSEIPDRAGIHECAPVGDALKDFRWDFTDAQLQRFWAGFAACNPELTARDRRKRNDMGYAYWGEGWRQACALERRY